MLLSIPPNTSRCDVWVRGIPRALLGVVSQRWQSAAVIAMMIVFLHPKWLVPLNVSVVNVGSLMPMGGVVVEFGFPHCSSLPLSLNLVFMVMKPPRACCGKQLLRFQHIVEVAEATTSENRNVPPWIVHKIGPAPERGRLAMWLLITARLQPHRR